MFILSKKMQICNPLNSKQKIVKNMIESGLVVVIYVMNKIVYWLVGTKMQN